jgi:hypothetical protein
MLLITVQPGAREHRRDLKPMDHDNEDQPSLLVQWWLVPATRLVGVDASTLQQPGGPGDDWRLHLASDFTVGRMSQVCVTDRYGGEHLAQDTWQAGDGIVADRGQGSRRCVATAVCQQADIVGGSIYVEKLHFREFRSL